MKNSLTTIRLGFSIFLKGRDFLPTEMLVLEKCDHRFNGFNLFKMIIRP